MIQSKSGEVIFSRMEKVEYRISYFTANMIAKAKFNTAFDLLSQKEKLAVVKMLLPKRKNQP